MTRPRAPLAAAAIDLPAGSPGGSVELFHDLYTGDEPLIPAKPLMLTPPNGSATVPREIGLLDVTGKCLDGPAFWTYVTALQRSVLSHLAAHQVDVLHLHHLAFGAAPALARAFPRHPSIALVHGTDLLFAATHDTQRQVLLATARGANIICVPTPAMADHLLRIAPRTDRRKIVLLPWGVPDHLLAAPPALGPRHGGPLRLLYAGRLTPEKGGRALARAAASVSGVEWSIAAPEAEYAALLPTLRKLRAHVSYLGWVPRRKLWQTFGRHDALVMPSTTLEAFGLVAVEAQACGLPVLYQPVPGLSDTIGDSGLPVDLSSPHDLGPTLAALVRDRGALEEVRRRGYRNARRFPLSSTAEALNHLGAQLA
ncbi:glycosyltransferase family 4 protein [Kitasatospora misakiensis]|uniref:Glycosyltransferase family 4 protein n=1 Tax=Kitasatospora misakiensis TaxID=67330 RepID=A0ABW0X3Q6_9ACTN